MAFEAMHAHERVEAKYGHYYGAVRLRFLGCCVFFNDSVENSSHDYNSFLDKLVLRRINSDETTPNIRISVISHKASRILCLLVFSAGRRI